MALASEVDIITASQELKAQTPQHGMDRSQYAVPVQATALSQLSPKDHRIFAQAHTEALFLQR